jgi:hypothetical protein
MVYSLFLTFSQNAESRPEIQFNEYDQICSVSRISFEGPYVVENGVPNNPIGRTGLTGRGLLGRWGPNFAADPIITRWKRDAGNKPVYMEGKKVLEFVAVERTDSKQWALPGVSMINHRYFFHEASSYVD